MTERTPISFLEKIRTCLSSLKVRRKTEASGQDLQTHPNQDDIEFLERTLGVYPKSETEKQAPRGPHRLS